jgi:hypothetical protein
MEQLSSATKARGRERWLAVIGDRRSGWIISNPTDQNMRQVLTSGNLSLLSKRSFSDSRNVSRQPSSAFLIFGSVFTAACARYFKCDGKEGD